MQIRARLFVKQINITTTISATGVLKKKSTCVLLSTHSADQSTGHCLTHCKSDPAFENILLCVLHTVKYFMESRADGSKVALLIQTPSS